MRYRLIWVLLLCCSITTQAQNKKIKLPENWFNLDVVDDGYFGISTEKAYRELLKDKNPRQEVIVAVIDGGVDINHEDLKGKIWTNKKEIPGNGIDDDGNGYVDDVHGWNFIGSKVGNLVYDNLELVRIYRKLSPKYKSTTSTKALDSIGKEEFALYRKVTAELGKKYDDADQNYRVLFAINQLLDSVAKVTKKTIPSLEDIEAYKPDDQIEEQVKKIIRKGSRETGGYLEFYKDIKKAYEGTEIALKYNLNPKYDVRDSLVGDDYANGRERNYGNNDVMGPRAEHGSHVSGIIAANRNNNIGIKGVAESVLIMPIRVVPEGDERDKDVANGIRYAVDNGARIINMSFGKNFKWDKAVVDEAIRYAEEKGVLLVHAAGNDNLNNDRADVYPTKYYDSEAAAAYNKKMKKPIVDLFTPPVRKSPGNNRMPGPDPRLSRTKTSLTPVLDTAKFDLSHAKNWIEVGASAYMEGDELKASFSNYGKYTVDVFAPGFMINSTVPGSKYEEFDGTSMAAPVVSGLAALILSHYPDLTAVQVKEIILKSVRKVDRKVKHQDEKGASGRILFSELSRTGGIVNAYNALKLASEIK
jgi:subtilisin family serine protease